MRCGQSVGRQWLAGAAPGSCEPLILMKKTVHTSFYFQEIVDSNEVLARVSMSLNAPTKDLFDSGTHAEITALFEKEESNFPFWMMLSYSFEKHKINTFRLGQDLAVYFSTSVITDLPAFHPLSSHPYKNILCLPNGKVFIGVLDNDDETENFHFVDGTLNEIRGDELAAVKHFLP